MALYYSETLTRKKVIEISDKYGFPNPEPIEKFIMCFEIHKHIVREVDCILVRKKT